MWPALTSDNPHLSDPNRVGERPLIAAAANGREQVSLALLDYLQAATPLNTRRAYASDLRHFQAWGGRIPASEVMVAEYLAAHADQLAPATLARRLAAIAKAHRVHGLPSPTGSALVRATLRGIRRVHGRPPRQAAPLLPDDLRAIVSTLGDDLRDLRDRALLLIGFAGAFRRSELVAIDCRDIEWVSEGILITLRRSKTDQEGRGRRVAIPKVQGPLCPVRALKVWLSAARIAEGPVFRPIDRHKNVSMRALTPDAVARVIKARVAATRLNPERHSGHSLRAGLATSAAAAGVPSWKIREQTGHASDAVLAHYIRNGRVLARNAVAGLLQR